MQPESPRLTFDLAHDVSEVLEFHFMVNALLGGSVVAVMAGLVGWLMVVRREAFAGHTLSMMAFPGASGAVLIGIAPAWGYFTLCAAGAAGIARLTSVRRDRWGEQSAAIGIVQASALAAGFLFVSLNGGVLGDLENLLFGNLLAISDAQVLTLAAVAAASVALLAAFGRRLLFASVDPDVAAARGLPVRGLSNAFLLALALAVAATSLITGPLLVFALLVAPAAAAQTLTARPLAGLALTVVLALAIAWLGLGIAYFSIYPAGFWISSLAFATYLLARAGGALRGRLRRAGEG
jgi:zinc/manganese transport system permease protein